MNPTTECSGAIASARLVPHDLLLASALALDPAGLIQSSPIPVHDNAEYSSHEFTVNDRATQWREARTTPTKNGLFVAVWKRNGDGTTRPYSTADLLDLFVISARQDAGFGQFVFSRDTLRSRGVLSDGTSVGKRGFRVYPPWVVTESGQAARTQAWQCESFLALDVASVDLDRVHALYRQ